MRIINFTIPAVFLLSPVHSYGASLDVVIKDMKDESSKIRSELKQDKIDTFNNIKSKRMTVNVCSINPKLCIKK